MGIGMVSEFTTDGWVFWIIIEEISAQTIRSNSKARQSQNYFVCSIFVWCICNRYADTHNQHRSSNHFGWRWIYEGCDYTLNGYPFGQPLPGLFGNEGIVARLRYEMKMYVNIHVTHCCSYWDIFEWQTAIVHTRWNHNIYSYTIIMF